MPLPNACENCTFTTCTECALQQRSKEELINDRIRQDQENDLADDNEL